MAISAKNRFESANGYANNGVEESRKVRVGVLISGTGKGLCEQLRNRL